MLLTLKYLNFDDIGGIKLFYFFGIYGLTIRLVGYPINNNEENQERTSIDSITGILGLMLSFIFFPAFFSTTQLPSISYTTIILTLTGSIFGSCFTHILASSKISL